MGIWYLRLGFTVWGRFGFRIWGGVFRSRVYGYVLL